MSECEVLEVLYNSTNGVEWLNSTGWLDSTTPCTWYGISCTAGQISSISLGSNNLVGTIPPELGNLGNLSYLHLMENQLTGSIPVELANLSNLSALYLGNNQLTGAIPTGFGSLTNLSFLHLGGNQLSGTIPNELGNLSNLSFLNLSTNQLTGSIPPDLGNLSKLQSFFLAENLLTGSIPVELGNLSQLSVLNLNTNQLTGSIPVALSNLNSLTQLNLRSNLLTGAIPVELANLNNLTALYLNENQLSGTIPVALTSLSNLAVLNLSNNLLTGTIPVELANLSMLTSLFLGVNQLSGNIPVELANLSSLSELSLYANQLTGSIPAELGTLSNLRLLNLNENQLTGTIPVELASLNNLTWLALSDNQLTGSIPVELANLLNLYHLNLHRNQLTGTIPVELGSLSNLSWLSLGDNLLTGGIPVELGNLSSLANLYLAGNQLTGSIPVELGNLSNLQILNLSSNLLTGAIPTELGNLTNLEALNLSENDLTGSIPAGLGNFGANFTGLLLHRNQLSGPLPATLGNLTNLTSLWIQENALLGEIPASITNLVNLSETSTLLKYNALYTTNPGVAAFLDSKSPGWSNTQTVAPTNLSFTTLESNATLYWTPIAYQADGGYYALEMAPAASGPFTQVETTATKADSVLTVSDLLAGNTYYFRLRTFTQAWWLNPPALWSDYTEVIPVTISAAPFSCSLVSEIPTAECEILVSFYEETNGPGWVDNTGWKETISPCTWHGVGCTEGHVTSIDVNLNQLSGSIPTVLSDLTSLTTLNLGSNLLTGPIPAVLGNLSNLTSLSLNANQLSGSLPSELGNLVNLIGLRIDENSFSGEVPTSLTNLSNLSAASTQLGYNALYTTNPAVKAFLDTKDPAWADTQTVVPGNFQGAASSLTEIELTWTPILYSGGTGYYEVSYATDVSGPYSVAGSTVDKTASNLAVTGLTPGQTYYFRVRTFSAADWLDPAELWSEYSTPISVTMPTQPIASFTGSVLAGQAPLSVYFTNTSTGTYSTSSWDFGDGFTSSETNPTHTYYLTGTYTVTLTVSGLGGDDSETKTAYIAVTALAQSEITPGEGGALVFTLPRGATVNVQIPAGAVTQTITLQATINPTTTVPGGLGLVDESFHLEALLEGLPLDFYHFAVPLSVRVDYSNVQVIRVEESSLTLRTWNGNTLTWDDAALNCTPPSEYTRNLNENWFSVNICHLSQFAIFGDILETGKILYLPLIWKP